MDKNQYDKLTELSRERYVSNFNVHQLTYFVYYHTLRTTTNTLNVVTINCIPNVIDSPY